MPVRAIVSYDGTDNDHDAVALGRVFKRAGAVVGLAYVRHARESEPAREEFARDQVRRMLSAGAVLLGDPDAETEVVLNASTPGGLSTLASMLDADLIIFGSSYRPPPGRLRPGTSAERLLDGGATAIAIAVAGMRGWTDAKLDAVNRIGHDGSVAARETAETLARALGGSVAEGGPALMVVGSRAEAPPGRVALAATTRQRLEDASTPVLVVPGGSPLDFGA